MTVRHLYASATNISNISSVRFTEAHNDATPICTISCLNTTAGIGDSITVAIGYEGEYSNIMTGFVKDITKKTSPTEIDVTIYGEMIRAVDYFLVSDTPDDPFTRSNISAEDLVEDLMDEAGLTNFGYDATSFIFATQAPLEVNLVSVYDYCHMIAKTLAWHLYADNTGKVWFVDRKPYVMGSDSSVETITDSEILSGSYSISERDLRNKIVVYGMAGVSAVASQGTSYNPITDSDEQILPSGFYKAVLASAEWIDTQSMAQGAADYNLDLLNRLQVEANIQIEGDSNISCRDVITVTSTALNIDHDFYVYTVDHMWDQRGFVTNLILRM